jgi:nucleoside-diphosphate-sugar epimerase
MRVFLTGATGYIGSAALDALTRAGHEVTALVRRPAAAERLGHRAARCVIGDLSAWEGFRHQAQGYDAYVHTAFEPSTRGAELDATAVDELIALARDAQAEALVYTSGIWVLGNTQGADESAPVNPTPLVAFRPALEQRVLTAGGGRLRTSVVRPGVVFGSGRGIVGDLLRDAENGIMRVVGTGENYWPLVYDRDVADLYVRIVGNAIASGIYHATDDSAERVSDVVGAIAGFASPRPDIRHMPYAEAKAKLGAYADAITLDQVVHSPRARELGWQPTLGTIVGNVPRLFEEWRNARRE